MSDDGNLNGAGAGENLVSTEVVSSEVTTLVIPENLGTEALSVDGGFTTVVRGPGFVRTLTFNETGAVTTTLTQTRVTTIGGVPITNVLTPAPRTSVRTLDGAVFTRVFTEEPVTRLTTSGGTVTTQVEVALATLNPHVVVAAPPPPPQTTDVTISQSATQSYFTNLPTRTLIPSHTDTSVPAGAIVGAVLGILLFLSLCVAAFLFLRRRTQRRYNGPRALGLRTESLFLEGEGEGEEMHRAHPRPLILYDEDKKGSGNGTGSDNLEPMVGALTLEDEVLALRSQLARMEVERAMAEGTPEEAPPRYAVDPGPS
ncbi:hypothetical protein C8R46DRAFT_1296107 [Mycena filopes]|nr:hypothetical protein C8R46DRAFT_1296107 [Mycena filopes]